MPCRCQALLSLLLLGALGCGDDDPAVPDFDAHPVVVAPAEQWAGGEITLTSAAFRAWPEELLLLIGDVIVDAERTSDSTFVALVPDSLPGGHHVVQAAVIESPTFSTGFDVAGWTDTRAVALTGTSEFSTPWPVDDPRGLLLVKDDTIRFIRADDGVIRTFAATTTTWRTPLGHDAQGRVLAPLNTDTLLAWALDLSLGTAGAVDTIVRPTDPDHSYYTFAAGGSLWTSHDLASFTPGELKGVSYVTSPRAVASGGAGRIVVPYRLMDPAPAGIPIFRTDSGNTAALVTGYSRLDAATFDGAGTGLFLAVANGGLASTTQSLLRVDPVTGTILDSVAAMPQPRIEDLAHDATRGWLFAAVRDEDRWTLQVRDAATLDLIAQVRSPTHTDTCHLEGELHIIQIDDVVYLGTGACTTGTGDIRFARFTLK